MPLPILQGVRILDLTHFLAGPAMTRLLAELGAEVVKVESAQHYDGSRSMFPASESDAYERSPSYNFFNSNKLGVTLNLQDPRGVAMARELVMVSDAVVDNFPTGTMARLGPDDKALWSRNPSLGIMSMAGYGQRGSWRSYPTYATSLAMMAGLFELTGHPDGQPTTPSVAGVDPMNGVIGANALLMALMYRRRTGRGLRVDYAQLEATTTLVGEVVADYSVNGRVATRQGNRHPIAASHGIYPCREEDTWVSIAVFGDEQFQCLCQLMAVGNQRKWDTLRPERLEIWRGLGELPEGVVVAPSLFDCVGLHLLPALQYPFPPPVEHICRCHIAQRLVIAPVVVVGHEGGKGSLQIGSHLVGDLLDVSLDSLVIALQLAVGLRVEGCSPDVLDSHQAQVVSEATGHIS